MTLSREALRRKEWRDRHRLDAAEPSSSPSIPEQQGRALCIVWGCRRPRQARSQLCGPCDRETDRLARGGL